MREILLVEDSDINPELLNGTCGENVLSLFSTPLTRQLHLQVSLER
jgi:hypothetical protein